MLGRNLVGEASSAVVVGGKLLLALSRSQLLSMLCVVVAVVEAVIEVVDSLCLRVFDNNC